MAEWSLALGILLIVVGIILSIIFLALYRKYYIISFICGIGLYIFSVAYAWDLYDLSKNKVMILLLLSTVVLGLLGKYISSRKSTSTLIEKTLIGLLAVLVVSLFVVNVFSNGTVEYDIKERVEVSSTGVEIGIINLNNPSFLPAVVDVGHLGYCEEGRTSPRYFNYGTSEDNYIELASGESREIALNFPSYIYNEGMTEVSIYKYDRRDYSRGCEAGELLKKVEINYTGEGNQYNQNVPQKPVK